MRSPPCSSVGIRRCTPVTLPGSQTTTALTRCCCQPSLTSHVWTEKDAWITSRRSWQRSPRAVSTHARYNWDVTVQLIPEFIHLPSTDNPPLSHATRSLRLDRPTMVNQLSSLFSDARVLINAATHRLWLACNGICNSTRRPSGWLSKRKVQSQ